MKSNNSPRSIRYSAPEDAGMQITAEILKIFAVVVGVSFTPILLRILTTDRFLVYQPWFWMVGTVFGLILILFGSIYAFRQSRQLRRLQALRAPRRLLLERLLPPFRVEIFTRPSSEKADDTLPEELANRFTNLQATLPWSPGYELLPPFGYQLHPNPLQARALDADSQATTARKMEALQLMRRTGQMEADEFEEIQKSLLLQDQTKDIDQKLQALKAMRDAGLMSRPTYNARIREIEKAATNRGQHQETWLILPTLLITLGGFILLYAVVAFLMRRNDVTSPQLIALYFSSPVFLIWITTEILYAYPLFFMKAYRRSAHIVGIIKVFVQVVAALILWFFLGLYFGLSNIDILFYIGAGLACLGLILGIVSAGLNRRLARQALTFAEAAEELLESESSLSPPMGISPATASVQDEPDASGHQAGPQPEQPTQAMIPPAVSVADPLPQTGYFHLYQGEDNAYYFRLTTSEGVELFFSSGMADHRESQEAVNMVKQNAPFSDRYRREQTAGNLHFFLLTTKEQKVLAISHAVNNESRLAWLIAACQLLAYTAPVRDETDISPRQVQAELEPPPYPRPAGVPATEEAGKSSADPVEAGQPENIEQGSENKTSRLTVVSQPAPVTSGAKDSDGSEGQKTSSSLVEAQDPGKPDRTPPTASSGNQKQQSAPDASLVPVAKSKAAPTVMVRAPKFQLFQGQDKQYYFRLLAQNGESVLASEGYKRSHSALKGIHSVQQNAPLENRFRRETAENGQYYFTLLAGNHEVIGKSELYVTAQSRDRGVAAVQRIAAESPIEVLLEKPFNRVEKVTQPDPPRALLQKEKVIMKGPKFTIFTGANNQHYFRLVAGNNEVVLASEAYTSKRGCQNGIRSVKTNASLDKRYRRQIAQDGQHYFELIAGNHQVIGVSEMYSSLQNCEKGIAAVQRIAADAPIEDNAQV